MNLNELDRVEILSLQDNYIDMTAVDNSDIVLRAKSVCNGEICNSVQAEHGFSALFRLTCEGRTKTLLFDFGFSEHGTADNADALDADLRGVEVLVLSHSHGDHTGAIHPEHVRHDAQLPGLSNPTAIGRAACMGRLRPAGPAASVCSGG
jgi:7,8-dihydropterin-6-yl-methyl-4-(beta-D-ribofuranosyl)aminobenzene 5'-phosphate synthase